MVVIDRGDAVLPLQVCDSEYIMSRELLLSATTVSQYSTTLNM